MSNTNNFGRLMIGHVYPRSILQMKLDIEDEKDFHYYVLVAIIEDSYHFVRMTSQIANAEEHMLNKRKPKSVITYLNHKNYSFLNRETCINCIFVQNESKASLIQNWNENTWIKVLDTPLDSPTFECIVDGIIISDSADAALLYTLNKYRETKSIDSLIVEEFSFED